MKIFLIITVFLIQNIFANEIIKNEILKYKIDKEYAEKYSELIVQSKDGRMKPLDSLNIDILNKIYQKRSFFGLNHNQVILGMVYTPALWKKVELVNIKHYKIKELLNTKKNKYSFNDFFEKNGDYKFQNSINLFKEKDEKDYNALEKELIKIDERIRIAKFIYNQGFLKIYPLKETKKWYSHITLREKFKNDSKYEAQSLYVLNKNAIYYALESNDWSKANEALAKLKEFQNKYGKKLIPSEKIRKAELLYNDYLLFEKLYPLYFFASIILLSLVCIRLFLNKNLTLFKNVIVASIVLGFSLHTFNLILRWYISSHAPWSNAYESMIFISWTIILAGLFFIKKSEFALSSTTLLASILLFVAHLSWMDPQITTLTPSLQSIWLTIHVAVISASYGFLALSFLLGLFTLILMSLNKKDQIIIKNIKEAFKTNELSMIIGLSLLTIGTLLGSVWANESWGRIWEWDPKETWSLASIFVYMIILHLRFIPNIYTIYNFSVLSILGYSSILMTYFGVNYFFDAIHVYASNSNAQIPNFAYYVLATIIIIILFSFKNRKMELGNV